jgi:hypothetical protein
MDVANSGRDYQWRDGGEGRKSHLGKPGHLMSGRYAALSSAVTVAIALLTSGATTDPF